VKIDTLTFDTRDSVGVVATPDLDLIGVELTHTGNQKRYIITGLTWLGATDEWGFTHREIGNDKAVTITRPLGHISGLRDDGSPRFIQHDKTMVVGRGIFGWPAAERRSDRYGAFLLTGDTYNEEGVYSKVGWLGDIAALAGKRCAVKVTVLESRKSGHIGDMFRGIFPRQPEVGAEFDLGTGEFFAETCDGYTGYGLKPDDGRRTDWFDPEILYQLHDQTVEIRITVVG
jgi:hypothetical protein